MPKPLAMLEAHFNTSAHRPASIDGWGGAPQTRLSFQRCCSRSCFAILVLMLFSRFGVGSIIESSPESLIWTSFPRHWTVACCSASSHSSTEKRPTLCVRSRCPRDEKQKKCSDAAICVLSAEGLEMSVPHSSTATRVDVKIILSGIEEVSRASVAAPSRVGRSAMS